MRLGMHATKQDTLLVVDSLGATVLELRHNLCGCAYLLGLAGRDDLERSGACCQGRADHYYTNCIRHNRARRVPIHLSTPAALYYRPIKLATWGRSGSSRTKA